MRHSAHMGSTILRPEIRKDDIDTVFIFKVVDLSSAAYDSTIDCEGPALDLSAATELTMVFEKPDGTILSVEAEFDTTGESPGDGTDGRIMFRTPEGFLDLAGEWRRQAIVVLPPGTWRSTIVCFTVHENLE